MHAAAVAPTLTAWQWRIFRSGRAEGGKSARYTGDAMNFPAARRLGPLPATAQKCVTCRLDPLQDRFHAAVVSIDLRHGVALPALVIVRNRDTRGWGGERKDGRPRADQSDKAVVI